MALPNDFEGRADDAEHLRDSLESAWDEGQALADEKQVSRDVVASEIDRRDPSDRELYEAAYDAGMIQREARQKRVEAATGDRVEETAEPSDIRKSLTEGYDRAEGKAAEAKPETEPGKPETKAEPAPDAPALSAEDRAALDKMPPEVRQHVERQAAAVRQTYAPADALAGKWGGYLSQLGATTTEQQARAVDGLLATEHGLRTGTPEQKVGIIRKLVQEYGVGAPAQGAAPEAAPAAHPLQAAALAGPQAAPAQQPQADPNGLRARLESGLQAQRAAEAARQTPEAQAEAQRQAYEGVVGQMQEFAGQKDEFGHPSHALFNAVVPEMIEAANMIRAAGHTPDLPTVYQAAVKYAAQTRPEVAQAAMADARARVRAFKVANPVANDPQLERRMTSLATADQRLNGTVDLKSVLERGLKLEPDIAARHRYHAAREKELNGRDKPQSTLRQQLEAAWSAQAA